SRSTTPAHCAGVAGGVGPRGATAGVSRRECGHWYTTSHNSIGLGTNTSPIPPRTSLVQSPDPPHVSGLTLNALQRKPRWGGALTPPVLISQLECPKSDGTR